jgi:hypothetical protein
VVNVTNRPDVAMRLRPFKPLAVARTIAIKSAPRQALNRNDLLAFQHL